MNEALFDLLQTRDENPSDHYDAAAVVRHLAHELRQPLSAIESIAFYLRMTLSEREPKACQQIAKIEEMVEQTNWILADAVYFLGSAPTRPEIVDLHEVLAETLSDPDQEEGGRCRAEVAERRALVLMDPAQAKHLVRSLLAIGRRMARPPNEVLVRAWPERSESHLSVTVPGVEYSGDQLPDLFLPFACHLPAGSGMALASAHRIVERYGGRLEAFSKTGLGTSFLSHLPLAG